MQLKVANDWVRNRMLTHEATVMDPKQLSESECRTSDSRTIMHFKSHHKAETIERPTMPMMNKNTKPLKR